MAQRHEKPEENERPPLRLPGMYKRVPAWRAREIAEMRAIGARHNPEGHSLADDLIAERRDEAERD